MSTHVRWSALYLVLMVVGGAAAAAPLEQSDAERAKCLAILRGGLRSTEFWPAMHAAEALTIAGQGAEVREYLAPLLPRETDDQHRCGLARELVRAGDLSRAHVMLEILAGADPYGHVHAAESLYKVGELGDGRALRRAFAQEENLRLRLMAGAALARAGDTAALHEIRRHLADEDPQIAHLAGWILGVLGDASDIEGLRQAEARQPDPLMRSYQQHALALLGDPAGGRALIENLRSEHDAVRTYSANFAGDAGLLESAPALRELLDDAVLDVRVRAAQSLLTLALPRPDRQRVEVLPPRVAGDPDPLYQALLRRAHTAVDRRTAAFAELKTAEDCASWQRARREFFLERLGGLPERTPLNAEVVGKLDGGDYRVEKVIFESRPHHHVTATLYLPLGDGPHPASLIACGHTKTGKGAEYNQRIGILLARNGIAALCYDPIGQGERSQILDADGKAKHSGSTTEHFLAGVGAILVGSNTAQYRTWDGIRAIDYLCERSDIDPSRIGCTGCSGGGTETSYLMALDERITCAAPACYLTTFGRLLDTIGPQDAEQNIYGQVAFGLDHPDYVLLRAPRPTLICSTTDDFFDIGGTWDTFRQAKRFHALLGHSERVDLVETPGKHGVTKHGRESIVRWMRRWFLGSDEPITDPEGKVWTVEELRCTPRGEVLLLPGERSVHDIAAEQADELAQARAGKKLSPEQLRRTIRTTAGVRTLAELPPVAARSLPPRVREDGQRLAPLVLVTEEGLELPARLWPGREADSAPTLIVGAAPGAGASRDGAGPRLELDLRGLGESRTAATNGLGDWKNYYMAYLLEQSLVGLRAEDVLRGARWLSEAHGGARVRLVADGEATLAALHAAALEPQLFAAVELAEAPPTWREVVAQPESDNQLVQTIHGVLRHYDVPELRGLIENVHVAK